MVGHNARQPRALGSSCAPVLSARGAARRTRRLPTRGMREPSLAGRKKSRPKSHGRPHEALPNAISRRLAGACHYDERPRWSCESPDLWILFPYYSINPIPRRRKKVANKKTAQPLRRKSRKPGSYFLWRFTDSKQDPGSMEAKKSTVFPTTPGCSLMKLSPGLRLQRR